MSNYKKFTLDTIKQKLKNGDYEAPVGAMRAIGKTQELSEKDKEKARELVRKHFGVEAPAPKAKKVAKKTAKKAAAPKAVRKKKAAKKTSAAAPTSRAVRKKVVKKTKRGRATAASEGDTGGGEPRTTPTSPTFGDPATKVSASVPSVPRGNIVLEMGQVISTVGEAVKAMQAAKSIFPKAKLERDVEAATGAMARAVKIIDQEVMAPRLPSAGTSAPAATRKKGSKKGTRAKAATSASSAGTTEADSGTDLTEEEQEQLRLARETQPAAAAAAG